eukprot:Colp12_sorted_trinity150504_noHs@20700
MVGSQLYAAARQLAARRNNATINMGMVRFFVRSIHKEKQIETTVGSSKVVFGAGRLAGQADGSATVKWDETAVLVTVVCDRSRIMDFDNVPLRVEYVEKAAAAGKIPMTFLRRQQNASEKEILTSRAIDRAIRPLFPKNFSYNTQVGYLPS